MRRPNVFSLDPAIRPLSAAGLLYLSASAPADRTNPDTALPNPDPTAVGPGARNKHFVSLATLRRATRRMDREMELSLPFFRWRSRGGPHDRGGS